MILTIIIVLASLVILMALHELGHFLFAKKFGVTVEEFGIGYPPRIWGKKIKGTIYSINWLPLGAFVKITGQDGESSEDNAFSSKPIWQRFIILFAGGVSFWLVAFIILTFVGGISGVPTAIPDELNSGFSDANVQILSVSKDSPADEAGIKIGDILLYSDKVTDIQQIISENLGQDMQLALLRGNKEIEVSLTPRINPPQGEGAIGVGLVRVASLKTTWYKAPWQAVQITARQTKAIPVVLAKALKKKIQGEAVTDVQFVGPIGVGQMMGNALNQGVGNFLMLVAMVAIWLALFNFLPIPALDGGRILFLIIEGVTRKRIPTKIEQKINTIFFLLLILLMAVVTFRDIIRLF